MINVYPFPSDPPLSNRFPLHRHFQPDTTAAPSATWRTETRPVVVPSEQAIIKERAINLARDILPDDASINEIIEAAKTVEAFLSGERVGVTNDNATAMDMATI